MSKIKIILKNFYSRYNKNTTSKLVSGFTLIELMVAVSIFMIIMIMAMGSVIVVSDVSKKADKLRNSMDSVNFAMESMTRSIRMGTNYESGDDSISFISSDGKNILYYKDGFVLKRCVDSNINCVDMVSSEVKVDTLQFYVKGTQAGDTIQPSVYIIMKGVVDIKGTEYSFALQTMASQRNLEQPE